MAGPPILEASHGRRLFTEDDANALVPVLESAFRRIDPKLARLPEVQDLFEDREAYWGRGLLRAPLSERDAHAEALRQLDGARASVDEEVRGLEALGVEVKDVRMGLADFRARRDGDIVYLCWQRGEPKVAHWHTLEGGFAGRRPLEPRTRAEP